MADQRPKLDHLLWAAGGLLTGAWWVKNQNDEAKKSRAEKDDAEEVEVVCEAIGPILDDWENSSQFFKQIALLEALSQRLHVGANDVADPADFGVAVDFVNTGFFSAKTILQSLYCNIDSDFVPKFETVGDSLRD